MTEALQLWQYDFNSLENRIGDAECSRVIGTFVENEGRSASGVMGKWISENLKSVKMYSGWDGVIYPYFRVVKIRINP